VAGGRVGPDIRITARTGTASNSGEDSSLCRRVVLNRLPGRYHKREADYGNTRCGLVDKADYPGSYTNCKGNKVLSAWLIMG